MLARLDFSPRAPYAKSSPVRARSVGVGRSGHARHAYNPASLLPKRAPPVRIETWNMPFIAEASLRSFLAFVKMGSAVELPEDTES